MTGDRSETRTKTAREHDDSELAENVEPTPAQQNRSQGRVERDVGTQDERKRAAKGEDAGVTRVIKEDELENEDRPRRRPDMTP